MPTTEAQTSPPAVAVTAEFTPASVAVGGAATLTVRAQIAPGVRAQSDRIFSFYVNLFNEGALVAQPDYVTLVKPAADGQAQTSSTGTTAGAERRGIYDTFLNRDAAGKDSPVELFRVQVTGTAAGRARFRIGPGSGVPGLSADFLVAPLTGAIPFVGGDYTAAFAELTVGTGPLEIRLAISRRVTPGQPDTLLIEFTPLPARQHSVETASSPVGPWQALPGGPHNSGAASVTPSASAAFFRVRAD